MPTTIPTTTSFTRPGSPSTGDAYFETDTNNYIIYDGANWRGYVSDGITVPGVTNGFSGNFDGTDDAITCGNLASITEDGAFTTSIWFQFAGSPGSTTHMTMSGGSGGSNRFYVQLQSTTNIRYGNDSAFDDITIPTVGSSSWYHLATVQSGTTVTVYTNGVSRGTATVNPINSDWGNNFRIGSIFNNTGFRFNGLLDEAAIWNTALDAANINQIYNAGVPINLASNAGGYTQSSALKNWWRLGDHASDTVSGGGSPTSGGTIDNVENAADPGTNDGTGENGTTYSSTTP